MWTLISSMHPVGAFIRCLQRRSLQGALLQERLGYGYGYGARFQISMHSSCALYPTLQTTWILSIFSLSPCINIFVSTLSPFCLTGNWKGATSTYQLPSNAQIESETSPHWSRTCFYEIFWRFFGALELSGFVFILGGRIFKSCFSQLRVQSIGMGVTLLLPPMSKKMSHKTIFSRYFCNKKNSIFHESCSKAQRA